MTNNKSMVYGFLLGGITAGAAVLLSAPTSGKMVRKYVTDHSKELYHAVVSLRDEGTSLKDSVERLTKESASLVRDFSNDFKEAIIDWENNIDPHKRKIEKEIKSIEKTLSELEKTFHGDQTT